MIHTVIHTKIRTVPLPAHAFETVAALGSKRSQQCGQNKNKHIMEIERVEQGEQVSEKLVLSK